MSTTPEAYLLAALREGFEQVAQFHSAVGNVGAATSMREHAADLATLDSAALMARVEEEGDLLTRCAWHAPFRGRMQ